jgi:hypothetical protein
MCCNSIVIDYDWVLLLLSLLLSLLLLLLLPRRCHRFCATPLKSGSCLCCATWRPLRLRT